MPLTSRSARAIVTVIASAAVAVGSATAAGQALAQSPAQSAEFNIPAQELSTALLELGRQAGVQIAFVPDSAVTEPSAALKGRYSVAEALRVLLRGSGMVARSSGTGTWIVERMNPAGLTVGPPSPLEETLAADLSVTITGSRILRRSLDAPSPILVVEPEFFELTSNLGVEHALNQLPQFQPTETQFQSSVVANAFRSPGIAALDLRGLGANRGLVLIDGRRAQPANATLTVDVNSIPASAISSVEVISGGATSVYGADAVAGVVNFKLNRDFQGIALDAHSGITQQGDGTETRISALVGSSLSDSRGTVMFGGEWARRGAVAQRNRRFYTDAWADPGTLTGGELYQVSSYIPSAANLPSQAAVDAVFGGYAGVSNATPFFVNPDGSLFKNTIVVGNPDASSIRYTGSMDGIKRTNQGLLVQPEREQNLSSPMERYSIFGRAGYELSDRFALFLQANISANEVITKAAVAPATATFAARVPRDAAHPVPAELAAILDSRPDPDAPFHVDRYLDFMGSRRAENRSTVYQLLFGAQGEMPFGDWTWEAYVSHGETRMLNYLTEGWASRERFRRVVASPHYGEGLVLSSAGSYTSQCTTGLPIFEYFTPSQDCIDAISIRMKNITNLDQDVIEANFQGRLAQLPAGPLRAAVGLTRRTNSVVFDPDTINDTESVLDSPVGLFAAANTAGETRVKEVNAELLVPVLAGLPFMQQLNLELGGRYSDYDTAGPSWTWKALTTWKINEIVGVRGGYQFANRAPNVAELYLGVTQQVVAFPDRDPCTVTTAAAYGNVPSNPNRGEVQALCSAIIGSGTSLFDVDPNGFIGQNGPNFPFEREARSGSVGLRPEQADTFTIGAVLRLPRESVKGSASLTLDYYRVAIEDTIGPLAATTIYRGCFNANGVSNPTYSLDDPNGYCRLIFRDGVTGGRLQVTAPMTNLGLTRTSGIDMQLDWRSTLAEIGLNMPGSLAASVAVNYLLSFTSQPTPDSPRENNKGAFGQVLTGGVQTGQFNYRTFTTLSYLGNDWSAGLSWQHLPSIHNSAYVINPNTAVQGAGAYDLVNVFGTWNVSTTLSLRAGIDNLFDRQPEIVGREEGFTNAGGQTVPGFYDLLGRRFYAGVKLNF